MPYLQHVMLQFQFAKAKAASPLDSTWYYQARREGSVDLSGVELQIVGGILTSL